MFHADGSPQVRPIACLWLNYLPYWSGYIDTHSVKPELRDKISRFNLELADVAWSGYHDHILAPKVLANIVVKLTT
jgi:hypothetical protein